MEYGGYDFSRSWFDFSYDNPEKINPNHAALYFFCIEHCNRLGWKKRFGLPSGMAKEAIGIKSYKTYIKALRELEEWGFIKMVEKSKNQYSSNVIELVCKKKNKPSSYDRAIKTYLTDKEGDYDTCLGMCDGNNYQGTERSGKKDQSTDQSTDQSKSTINKPQTSNLKPQTKENYIKEIFEDFRKVYPGTKRGLDTEFANFKKHKDYNEVVNFLKPAIEQEIKKRAEAKKKKDFFPQPANLQTWINQRRWECESGEPTPTVEGKLFTEPVTQYELIVNGKRAYMSELPGFDLIMLPDNAPPKDGLGVEYDRKINQWVWWDEINRDNIK